LAINRLDGFLLQIIHLLS